jgi:molybdopterin molybdotransferase
LPGKPTWFSMRGGALALGLPGNPAAAFVCAHLFLKPLLAALEGAEEPPAAFAAASERDLGPGGGREEYLRAVAGVGDDGLARVRAAEDQDSSLLSPFLTANALIRRPKDAPAAPAGTLLSCLWLDPPVTRTTSAPARLKAASGEDQP